MNMATVVTDSNVAPLHGDRFVRSLEDGGRYRRVERIVIPAGEATKTWLPAPAGEAEPPQIAATELADLAKLRADYQSQLAEINERFKASMSEWPADYRRSLEA